MTQLCFLVTLIPLGWIWETQCTWLNFTFTAIPNHLLHGIICLTLKDLLYCIGRNSHFRNSKSMLLEPSFGLSKGVTPPCLHVIDEKEIWFRFINCSFYHWRVLKGICSFRRWSKTPLKYLRVALRLESQKHKIHQEKMLLWKNDVNSLEGSSVLSWNASTVLVVVQKSKTSGCKLANSKGQLSEALAIRGVHESN